MKQRTIYLSADTKFDKLVPLPHDILEGFGYRDVLGSVDWDFIHMKEYYEETRNRGVRYIPYNPSNPKQSSNGQYAFFRTPLSPESKERGYKEDAWYQTIQMQDMKESLDISGETFRNKVGLMVSGDLAVHCSCPAYNWYGYRYIMTELGAAIFPQPIEPKERNPKLKGVVCKHLAAVLKVLPFWSGDIARDLKIQGYNKLGDDTEDE